MLTPEDKKEISDIVKQESKGSFSKRIGDTPTDALQLVPKKYLMSGATTLTNKRVTMRVGSVLSSTNPSIDTDSYDAYSITALAANVTIAATGTPTDFQKLIVRIKDNGTARTITWSGSFAQYGSSLPSITSGSSVLTAGFLYDVNPSLWGCVANQQQ